MKKLGGKISDKIRSGELPDDVQVTGPRVEADDRPSVKAVRNAEGHGLGKGATESRSGDHKE